GRPVPTTSPFLTLAERQVVNDAGGEILIQVDLREAPIETLPVRERKVSGANDAPQAIRKSRIVGSRVSVSDERVNAVPFALGLGFDLQRIVTRLPGVINIVDGGIRERGIGHAESRAIRTASQLVSRDGSAGGGRPDIDVIAELQKVGTARTGITGRYYDVSGYLLLHV